MSTQEKSFLQYVRNTSYSKSPASRSGGDLTRRQEKKNDEYWNKKKRRYLALIPKGFFFYRGVAKRTAEVW